MKEAARWVDVRANATKFTLEWNGILGFNLVPAVAVKQEELMLVILRCKTFLDFFLKELNISVCINKIFFNLYEF